MDRMRSTILCAAALVGSALLLPGGGAAPASAQGSHTLNVASLAPRGSKWMRVFDGWSNTLKKETGGRLSLKVEAGGSSADDRAFVRRMKAGRLDGATLTTSGLAAEVPHALVLAVPGMADDPAGLDRARDVLSRTFARSFESQGYHLVGWVDLGQARLFSKGQPVRKPSDLRRMKPWGNRDAPIFPAVLAAAGARSVSMPVARVPSGLSSGRISVVPTSAVGAISSGWYTELEYMTEQPLWTLVGATVLRKEAYDALPAELRRAVDSSGAKAHQVLRKVMRREDQGALATLKARGLESVARTDSRAWSQLGRKAQKRLAGRYFPASLLSKVQRAAGR